MDRYKVKETLKIMLQKMIEYDDLSEYAIDILVERKIDQFIEIYNSLKE